MAGKKDEIGVVRWRKERAGRIERRRRCFRCLVGGAKAGPGKARRDDYSGFGGAVFIKKNF